MSIKDLKIKAKATHIKHFSKRFLSTFMLSTLSNEAEIISLHVVIRSHKAGWFLFVLNVCCFPSEVFAINSARNTISTKRFEWSKFAFERLLL